MKKVAFYVLAVITVWCAMGDITALQLLPLAIGDVLIALDIWGKKSMEIPITVLAVVMMMANGLTLSILDVVVWLLVAAVFFPRE